MRVDTALLNMNEHAWYSIGSNRPLIAHYQYINAESEHRPFIRQSNQTWARSATSDCPNGLLWIQDIIDRLTSQCKSECKKWQQHTTTPEEIVKHLQSVSQTKANTDPYESPKESLLSNVSLKRLTNSHGPALATWIHWCEVTNSRNAYKNEDPCASVRLLLCDGFPLKGSSVSNASARRPMIQYHPRAAFSTEGISIPPMLGMFISIYHVIGQSQERRTTQAGLQGWFRWCNRMLHEEPYMCIWIKGCSPPCPHPNNLRFETVMSCPAWTISEEPCTVLSSKIYHSWLYHCARHGCRKTCIQNKWKQRVKKTW